MSDNMFEHSAGRKSVTRAATGFGVALAAFATIGLTAGAAAAAPQQPFAADDPIPGLPGGAGGAVNIANSLFGSLSGLMNNVIPGAGDLLMPATGALGGGGGLPGGLPGGLGGLGGGGGLPGGIPGGLPGGLAGQTLPGQTPGLGGYPGSTVPGGPAPLSPAQGPGAGGPFAPAQAPLAGQPAGQQGPVASASASGGTLVHVPVV